MSCFPCFSRTKTHKQTISRELNAPPSPEKAKTENINKKQDENRNIAAQTFTFRELATATKNFRPECLLGEGGFGRVYRAKLETSEQIVAVKQLDRNGLQGNKEFLVEVLMLSLLHHQNLVNLVGYCADGDQRLLVYEYMSGGSVEDHLLDIGPDQKPLDWFTRMKIASGAARGLEYLHDKASPPVIYRDFKSSNILLDEDFNSKLSDFGLAKLGSVGDKIHVSSRVMGTYGYCAPEYARSGELTLKSDVYSFGVVLLELITGRRAIDTTRPTDEQNLVTWAQPIFKDPKRFPDMADPLLNRRFTASGLNQAVAIASMCLQEEASVRPLISDVVTALSFLSIVPDEGIPTPLPVSNAVSQESHVKLEEKNDHKKLDCQEQHHGNQDGESSDQDTDGEYDEEEESEDERQRAVTEAKEWALNSSHRSSRGSHNGSKPSSQNSSKKIQKGSLSSSHNSYRMSSEDGSVSSRGKSNTGSQFGMSSISSHNGSRNSQDGSVSFSHNSRSRKSQNENGISVSANSSRGSQQRSAFSIQKSSSESEDESVSSICKLSHNSSSKKSQYENGVSLSANKSRGSQQGSAFSIQKSSSESEDESVSSICKLSHNSSSKKSQYENGVSLSANNSRGSQQGSAFSIQKSSSESENESVSSICKLSHNNSSKKSQYENGVSLNANNSRCSQQGSAFSIQKSSSESEDESVSSIRKLSHKSSTKSQNERGSLSHKLSHRLSHESSRGSHNDSFSSSTSSNRSGNGRVSSSS